MCKCVHVVRARAVPEGKFRPPFFVCLSKLCVCAFASNAVVIMCHNTTLPPPKKKKLLTFFFMVCNSPSDEFWNASRMYTSAISASCGECVCWVFCVRKKESYRIVSHAAFHSLSHTHTAVTHPSRQWISHRGSFASGVGTMDGTGVTSCPAWWVVSVSVCVCVSLCVLSLFPISASASVLHTCKLSVFPLSIHPFPCFLISPSPPFPLPCVPESWVHCQVERCWVLLSCCCQLSPQPLQDKAVIAPGTAGLGSSSSKQICCNFICNWALNWEQIEAALWRSGKGEGSELGVVGEAGEMIPVSFMSSKVGLLSGREPRQGSYF